MEFLDDLILDPGVSVVPLPVAASPNPFRQATALRINVPEGRHAVIVDVLAVDGRKIRRLSAGDLPGGLQEVAWDGRNESGEELPAGVYLVRVRSGHQVAVLKLVRLR
jgi:flagellar basal-body rod modification protein FlgD